MKTILLADIRMRTFQYRDYGKLRYLIPYTAQILMFIGLFAFFSSFKSYKMSFLPFFSGKALSLLYLAAVFAFAINIPLSFHSYQNVRIKRLSKQLETILATPIKESELMLAKVLAMYPEQSGFLFILFFVKLIVIEIQGNHLFFVWGLVLSFLLVISIHILLMWCVLGIQVKRSLIVLNSSGKSMGSKITRFHLSLSVLSLMTLFVTTLMIVLCKESQYLFILRFTPIEWLLFYFIT